MTLETQKEEVLKDFVSDRFVIQEMRTGDYLPFARGWFGLEVVGRERDHEKRGYNYFLRRKTIKTT